MTQTVHVKRADVGPLIDATFPGYRGAKVQITAAEQVTLSDLNWSGGTRSQYRGCTLAGKRTGGADAGNSAPPWANQYEGACVPIPLGMCLVEHCLFCGKDLGLRIYVHPSDMPRWLPTGTSDLSDTERKVLKIIRSLISSYRREEAAREGINARQYEETLEALKVKGLLNSRGALTLEGKNAAGSL